MKDKYLFDKLDVLIETGEEPSYESISLRDFLTEFDYATKYLSRILKARSLVVYILLFKIAYLEQGERNISVKVSHISEHLLSDLGKPMSKDTVRKGMNDLIQNKVIGSSSAQKPGQINIYEVKLPSEIKEVRDMIKKDNDLGNEDIDDLRDDYYTNVEKRIEILERDNHLCFYCHTELSKDDFNLDHIIPKTQGGHNYKCNLVSACKPCNTKKKNKNSNEFLLNNYRIGLLTQDEYLLQNEILKKLKTEYLAINA